jgi:hypothetical protein
VPTHLVEEVLVVRHHLLVDLTWQNIRLVGLVGAVGLVGTVGLVGLVGLEGLVELVGLARLVRLAGSVGLLTIDVLNGGLKPF